MDPPDPRPAIPPARQHAVERYFAAFLSPTVASEAVRDLERRVAGRDDLAVVELFRSAHDVLEQHVAVTADVEAIVLADDAALPPDTVAMIVGLEADDVREVLREEGLLPPAAPRPADPAPEREPAPGAAGRSAEGSTPEDAAAAAAPRRRGAVVPAPRRRAEGLTPLAGSPVAIAGVLVLLVLLALVVVPRLRDRADPCVASAPVTVVEDRMTDFVDLTGEPGPARTRFAPDEAIKLWVEYDRATDDPVTLTIAWFRGDTALYGTDFLLPGPPTRSVNVTLVEIFREPSDDYRVEVRDGDCTLLRRDFSIEAPDEG